MSDNPPDPLTQSSVHTWFGLSYASYVVLPRSVLQSMDAPWQQRFVELMGELGSACTAAGITIPETEVHALDAEGKPTVDPLEDYQRGRRNVFLEGVGDLVGDAGG
jgi:hypothetical protein